jgi:hypothetical protein
MSGYFKNGPDREEPPAKPKSEYNPYAEEEERERYLEGLEEANRGIMPRRRPRRSDYGRGPRI